MYIMPSPIIIIVNIGSNCSLKSHFYWSRLWIEEKRVEINVVRFLVCCWML